MVSTYPAGKTVRGHSMEKDIQHRSRLIVCAAFHPCDEARLSINKTVNDELPSDEF